MGQRRRAANRIVLGRRAEHHARRWLESRGLAFVARNFRCRHGELDLIMLDGEVLVFVEVRCRVSRALTRAVDTVDPRKQRRLTRAAGAFLASQPAFSMRPARFDVIGFDKAPETGSEPDWLRDAFRPETD